MNEPKWVKLWIADLSLLNDKYRDDSGTVDFEALGREEYLFRMALISGKLEKSERAKRAYEMAFKAVKTKAENGRQGGRPPKNGAGIPVDSAKLYEMAARLGVDEADARNCWDATVERGGKDADGRKIKNFEAFLVTWCETAKANRSKSA